MSVFDVTIKWGKEKFPNVTLDTSEPPEVLRGQIFALTNVPPERQKIMAKGATLKTSWEGFESKLKKGAILLLMGSADPLPEKPKETITFAEDMTEGELLKAEAIPPGLHNLGNTCYLNSVIQCLRTIPELGVAFKKMPDQTEPLLMSMGALWNMMNDASDAQTPIFLLTALHQRFPQFAEKDASKGVWKQQDANEAWLAIVQFLQTLKGKNSVSLINELMGLKFKSTTKITEEGVDEPTTVESSSELSLSCFINQDVKYLITGIKNKMVEEIEKNSPTLSRNAVYERTSRVTRLPKYVAINLIRFFYKTDKQCSAKVLKDVKFPEALDLFDICDEELREQLKPMRDQMKTVSDKEMEILGKQKKKPGQAKQDPLKHSKFEPTDLGSDSGSNNSGWYNLCGVLTHKGRSIDSGHYIGWTKNNGKWVKFDDDKVTHVEEQEILDLSGGGDWHTAYILIYEASKCPIITAELVESMDTL